MKKARRGSAALRYKNNEEQKFCDWATEMGGKFTKRGWPDFMWEGDDGIKRAVEVKARGDRVRPPQRACLDWLVSLGVRCYIFRDGHLFVWEQGNRKAIHNLKESDEGFAGAKT